MQSLALYFIGLLDVCKFHHLLRKPSKLFACMDLYRNLFLFNDGRLLDKLDVEMFNLVAQLRDFGVG